MADIDMEVDSSRPFDLGGPVDDDFIDFDTDMGDAPHNKTQVSEEHVANVSLVNDEDGQPGDQVGANDQIKTLTSRMENADSSADQVLEVDKQQMPELGITDEHPADKSEPGAVLDDERDTHAEDHDAGSSHEIDYENEEDGDPLETQQQSLEAEQVIAENDGLESEIYMATADTDEVGIGESDAVSHERTQVESSDGIETKLHDEAGEDDVEVEVTDAVEEQLEEDLVSGAIQSGQLDVEQTTQESGYAEAEELKVDDVVDYDEQEVVEHHEHDADAHSSGSISEHRSATPNDSEFPAITVQYKGDEFPFFSTSSDGFFSEISVLDDTMETLLAGFREELNSEIAQEDELVFQIDELGLEFAESSLQDSLSSVTLRQILEIFDLLVKNQDPDSSRTLYTYLFTKPSTSKRLEYLIDSATAGKGLDEVIHLFESPMPQSTGLLDADAKSLGAERLDDYGSLDEETAIDGDHVDPAEEVAGEGEQQDTLAESENHDSGQNGQEPEVNDNDEESHGLEEPAAHEDAEILEAAAEGMLEPAEEDDLPDDESNPFVHLELDEEDPEFEGATDDPEPQAHSDENEAQIPEAVQEDYTAETSATSTLKDEEESASINVDIIVDVDVAESNGFTSTNDAPANDLADNEELAEIDWRETPEAEAEAVEVQPIVGKRARVPDEDVNEDEENDVKRRRS